MKPPVIRYFSLPNGSKIMSLRESTLRAGLKAASTALAEMVRIDQEAGLYDPPGSEEMRNHINAQAVLLAEVLRDGILPATLRQKVWNAVNGEPTPPSPSEP